MTRENWALQKHMDRIQNESNRQHEMTKFLRTLVSGAIDDVDDVETNPREGQIVMKKKRTYWVEQLVPYEIYQRHRHNRSVSYERFLAMASNREHVLGDVGEMSRIVLWKKEKNEEFRAKYPQTGDVRFSHIVGMRVRMLGVLLETELDVLTLAFSYVYFERLVLEGFVTKNTRKQIGGACLLLASKINDSKPSRKRLAEVLEKHMAVHLREILRCEFWVFSSLMFDLVLSQSEYLPHYTRILRELKMTESEYLGDRMYMKWRGMMDQLDLEKGI